MSRYHAYLNTAKRIIEQYDARVPLAAWLKDFFREHKQMGSRDRKAVAGMAYAYYRLGHSAKNLPPEERILTGLFLSEQAPHEALSNLKPGWEASIQLPLTEKFKSSDVLREEIFPWQQELSASMDADRFTESFLIQPDLFLRIRPGNLEIVCRKLEAAGIVYQSITGNCLALKNAVKVDSVLDLDREAVVQDYNSQRVAGFIDLPSPGPPALLWDCCAASGGKSIMAHDLDPHLRLTVSDIRESILQNLHKRFKRAGIIKYDSFLADLSKGQASPGGRTLPEQTHIIADLPCSGSGTWARTPEQLYFFDPAKIVYYSNLQKAILANVIPLLAPGGQLTYVTCSVFRKENEDVVDFIKNRGLNLIRMELLQGYTMKADSMFVAVFTK